MRRFTTTKSTQLRFAIPMTAAIVLCAVAAEAQEHKFQSSLEIVPENSAFYVASMNHAKMWSAMTDSHAYQQLQKTPAAVKMRNAYRRGLFRGWDQFGPHPLRYYLEGWANSIDSVPGKMAMPLIREMVRNEIFIYGDDQWIDFTNTLGQAYLELFPLWTTVQEGDSPEQREMAMEIVRKYAGELKIPTLVIGAVVDDPSIFGGMIDLAHSGIEPAMKQIPDDMQFVADAYQQIQDDRTHMIAFTIRGDEIPWGVIAGSDPQMADMVPFLSEICAGKSVAMGVGVRDNLLLMTFGPSMDHVKQLGSGSLLIDHPKLAQVKQALTSGHALTSVTYASEELARAANDHEGAFDFIPGLIAQALDDAGHVPADQATIDRMLEEIRVAATELGKDFNEFLPTPGTYVNYSFITDEGIEGFTYNYAENTTLDSSEPLTLAEHTGPHPTLVVVDRATGMPEQYQGMRKWAKWSYDFATRYIPEFMDEHDNPDQVRTFMAELRPLLQRVDRVLGETLIPQMNGKQSAFVIDLSQSKRRWSYHMPATGVSVPLPAMAIIAEIRDKQAIEAAGSELLEIADAFVDLIRATEANAIPPDFKIPRPESKSTGHSDQYWYPLPEEAAMDESIAPHARLNSYHLAIGYSLDQTDQMMAGGSAEFFGPAGDSGNAMSLCFFDNRQLIDAIHAWTWYAIEANNPHGGSFDLVGMGESDLLDLSEAEIRESVEQLAEFLKCFHGYSSRSYMAGDAQVTHYLFRFQDLPAAD